MRILIRSFWLVAFALITMSEAEENLEALRSVWASADQFSSSFFKTVVKYNLGNLISSPIGININLAMVSHGARGNTEAQFRNVLHLPTSESLVTSGYQSLIDNLNNVRENKLAVANKVFVAADLNLKQSYKNLTEVYFRSSPQLVNFGREKEAAHAINSWVEQNTNNLIKNLITADMLNDMTKLVLVNAIYFKGQWNDNFDSQLTKNMQFKTKDGPKSVPIMYRQGKYKYGDVPGLDARFVVIPYNSDGLSMVIILPNKPIHPPNVSEKIQNINLTNILSNGEEESIELWLPKFKVKSMLELTDVLLEMGLTDAFSPHADFSGIADGDLFLTDVIQMAYIEVDERGSAGGSGGHIPGVAEFIAPYNDRVNEQFRINKPFYYYIIKTMKNEVGHDIHLQLFCGYVNEPKF